MPTVMPQLARKQSSPNLKGGKRNLLHPVKVPNKMRASMDILEEATNLDEAPPYYRTLHVVEEGKPMTSINHLGSGVRRQNFYNVAKMAQTRYPDK